jgi:hypothetical protein
MVSTCMSDKNNIALLQHRRDGIRAWLDDEAPYTGCDQKHLDANTPERAYWHHGYQAALTDAIDLLNRAERKPDSADTPR